MYEESVLEYLTMEHVPPSEEEELEQSKRNRFKKIRRYTAIGLATLGGGAVLGLTGGLAAPFIGAGLGTIIGAGGAAAISSTAGIAVVGSMFGVAGAGLTGFKMQKRIGDIEEFAFESLSDGSHLHITIAISGWLTKEDPAEFMEPWRTLHHSREQYVLRYESTYLLELGQAMDYLLQFALSMAVQETLKYTILAGIISAITWPTSLLTLASIIDNPWGVCCRRSAEVGRQLAEVLVQRQHGKRPVTLIGFSLGARVIYYCLEELGRRKGSAGVVQDAIFLGAPVPGHWKDWKEFRHVVSGRIINGYCSGDWLLRFLYRSSTGTMRIAGLSPVDWQDRRMFNFDLSDIVTGHMDYAKKMDVILRLLGIRTRDPINDLDPRVKKSASDYPGFMSMHGKMEKPSLRTSTSDSFLLCGRDAPLTRSYSTDDILMAASDDNLSKKISEDTKSRARSSSDLMQKSIADVGRRGSVLQQTMKTRESLEALNCSSPQLSEREPDSKESQKSKPFFSDLFSKKPAPPTNSEEQPKTQPAFAQERFKRRTVSSSNLFLPRTSSVGKREFLRSSSQDQGKGSFFQFFSRKQEPIEEDP
ncbi:transmembrane and coiled-coil domain-containing protein 4-like [Palaemon carinicauda]|uniref:transmembrane and coiled-coil domain-containing protein 4-like n=1 Tax=Palaemon carinicauda TaxID=392227 RepID=UPI0035B63BB8